MQVTCRLNRPNDSGCDKDVFMNAHDFINLCKFKFIKTKKDSFLLS